MLDSSCNYSNYHSSVDNNGYFKGDDIYSKIRWKTQTGLIRVPVVHCIYFIDNKYLPHVSYDDRSHRYEYVIFSDVLRKKGIPQFLDNSKDYGFITFATTAEEFKIDYERDILKKYRYLINGKED